MNNKKEAVENENHISSHLALSDHQSNFPSEEMLIHNLEAIEVPRVSKGFKPVFLGMEPILEGDD